ADQLAEIGLASFPLLSGGKGVHVVVPLTPQAEWPVVRDFAERFAKALAAEAPTDADRVQEIRRAIQNGSFPILPATIADRLIALKLNW
ncbi:flagellar biosynthesis anti-sigma factor FlgM, partial [Enterobacter hormaechei]|nr:flagellar biosynthesis anti-sigma factor FlgM [Enterobacter hormaechei]